MNVFEAVKLQDTQPVFVWVAMTVEPPENLTAAFIACLDLTDSKEAAMKIAIKNSRQKPSIRPKIREPTPSPSSENQGAVRYNILRKWEKQYDHNVKPLWWKQAKDNTTLTITDLNYLMLYLEKINIIETHSRDRGRSQKVSFHNGAIKNSIINCPHSE